MEKDQTDPRLLEYEKWKNIISSPDWSVFSTLMAKHRKYLKDQIVISVGDGKIDAAVKYQARYEECDKIMENVETRISELKTQLKGGE